MKELEAVLAGLIGKGDDDDDARVLAFDMDDELLDCLSQELEASVNLAVITVKSWYSDDPAKKVEVFELRCAHKELTERMWKIAYRKISGDRTLSALLMVEGVRGISKSASKRTICFIVSNLSAFAEVAKEHSFEVKIVKDI